VATALILAAFAASFMVPAIRARTTPAPGARPTNQAKTDADAANRLRKAALACLELTGKLAPGR
jgi:hypothetical protein